MKLLVIEDNKKIADNLKKGLELNGYAVDLSYNGEDGYYDALDNNYDLILLDLMLPKMTGEEICKNLRENKIETPIIMLTAKSLVEDKVNGLNLGADDYLSKPFSFDELLARIRALLRRPKNYSSDIILCEELKLDIQNKVLKKNNNVISLSKKEFSLLEYFLRNKNKVLSKDMIIDHVWNFDSDILPNTVEVYIRYLRNKIDDNKNSSFIKTVRGFGYKIECK